MGGSDLINQTNTVEAAGIETAIVELLAQRIPAGIKVSPQTQIVGGLGLDSVGILDFIMDVEDRFDISIPLDRVAEVQTIAELSQAIEALKRVAH
jgi:acyl carrier protein